MGLLGKTLKGRSTRPGGLPVKPNIKIRHIAKNQEEFDQLKVLAKQKKEKLKSRIKAEEKVVTFNKKKLLTYWRKIMRIAKTEQLKNEIDIYAQNNQRNLDSKEAFIQMLDKNLDESEDQFQIALRNHLIHIENLLSLQNSRMRGLHEEFVRDIKILESEFKLERDDMVKTHKIQVKELDDMQETVHENEKRNTDEAKNEFQAFREETKNKSQEEEHTMTHLLGSRQTKYYNDLEQMHQKYLSDTAKKNEEHSDLFKENKAMSNSIDLSVRTIANKKARIELMRLKISQHTKECNARNQALAKEKKNIQNCYHELKAKMIKRREGQNQELKELVNNSRNAVLKLNDYGTIGERILKTAELCRRLETEKEKVLPFYETTVDESEIPVDQQTVLRNLTSDEAKEYAYLNNFYKRYNKVLLDKLAIEKQREALKKDNILLKSLLKQYLDGISLNDDVLKSNNPLFVVNNKINIQRPPIERVDNKIVIEGSVNVKNTQLQLEGQRAPPSHF